MATRFAALVPTSAPHRIVLLFLLGLLLTAGHAQAQYVVGDTVGQKPNQPGKPPTSYALQPREEKPPFFDRLNFGGNFGLNFGQVTYVEVSPLVVYNVTDKFQVGPGLSYIYYKSNVPGYDYSSSQYGGRLFGRYIVYQDFFVQTEVQGLSINIQNQDRSGRYFVVNPLVGGGYKIPVGRGNGGVYVTALYNLNYQSNLSIYPSPLILRVGFAL